MKYLALVLLLLMVGCRSLPQDTTPAPITHNKMTLEIQACNKQEVGLNGCFYKEDLSEKLVIPLWATGEYQIQSERCHFFENKRYDKTQKLEFSYEQLLAQKPETEDGCLYNIKVFIDGFDNGFEGFFVLAKGDIKAVEFAYQGRKHDGYAGLQIREGELIHDSFMLSASTPGTVIWEGCQKKGERHYSSNPEINFQEIMEGEAIPKATCVLTLGILPDDQNLPPEYGKVHINVYEKTVVSLPEPSFEYTDGMLTVTADKMTAVLAIGDSWTFKKGSNAKKFSVKIEQDEVADVRIATSNGRYMLLKVKNGVVLWSK